MRNKVFLAALALYGALSLSSTAAMADGGGSCCSNPKVDTSDVAASVETGTSVLENVQRAANQDAASGMSCCSKESSEAHAAASGACCTGGGHGEAAGGAGHGGQAATVAEAQRGGHGGKHGRGPGGQARGGKGAVMRDAMALIHQHQNLERTVEEIPKGVRTTTTTDNPNLVALLHKHPQEMYGYYESGGVVRGHDPLFRELSRVSDKVDMSFKELENGIEVTVTSEDPEIVKLVRAHAYKVSDFVKRGRAALHEGMGLPEGYTPPAN